MAGLWGGEVVKGARRDPATSQPRHLLRSAARHTGGLALLVQLQARVVVGLLLRVAGDEFQRLLLPLQCVVELAALGAGGRQRVEEPGLAPLGQLARPRRALAGAGAVAHVRVRAGAPDPGELVERAGVPRVALERLRSEERRVGKECRCRWR